MSGDVILSSFATQQRYVLFFVLTSFLTIIFEKTRKTFWFCSVMVLKTDSYAVKKI